MYNERVRINTLKDTATLEHRLLTLEESTTIIINSEKLRREIFDTILKL
jgi:hypothetical protein